MVSATLLDIYSVASLVFSQCLPVDVNEFVYGCCRILQTYGLDIRYNAMYCVLYNTIGCHCHHFGGYISHNNYLLMVQKVKLYTI